LHDSFTGINGGIDSLNLLDVYLALHVEGLNVTEILHDEIHKIAYFYHWGESEILALPILKRKDYVKRIKEQVEAENGTDEEGEGD